RNRGRNTNSSWSQYSRSSAATSRAATARSISAPMAAGTAVSGIESLLARREMGRFRLAQGLVACAKMAAVGARLTRLFPFHTPEARRLAILFGIVYFAQGTWYLPD